MPNPTTISYGEAIREGFEYLLQNHKSVFVIGQGLWSPWYVGNSMTDLDVQFGKERVIDTPVSELACTGAAVGASLSGYRPIIVHPRVDFMMYAMDAIVNQAAKWSHMVGGQAHPAVTIRGIVNRGGEQGAQHSQSLHSWFAHIPGLRVVMPATPLDARDLLIAATLCDDPVVYLDDRWLYEATENYRPVVEKDLILSKKGPRVLREGDDITLVGSGFSTELCRRAAEDLGGQGVSVEVVDLRVVNPLDPEVLLRSVRKTRRLGVVDGSWANCGLAGEVIATVVENGVAVKDPFRITLPPAPAPTSRSLETGYYPAVGDIVSRVRKALA